MAREPRCYSGALQAVLLGGGHGQDDVDQSENGIQCSYPKPYPQDGWSLGASADGRREGKEKLKRYVEKNEFDPVGFDAIDRPRKEAILALQRHVDEEPGDKCLDHPLEGFFL